MRKFLLVDDHLVVRSGMQKILTELYAPCEVHDTDDPDKAIEKLKQHAFDMVMLDIQIPKADMLGLMEYIHIKYPDTKVLVFSMNAENIYAKRFLKAGARGFLSKHASLDEMKKAIDLILNNRKYFSPSLMEALADDSFSDKPMNPFERLSPREFEVASLLLSGQTVAEISRSLNVQSSTIGTHKARVFEKLGITSLLELKEMADSFKL